MPECLSRALSNGLGGACCNFSERVSYRIKKWSGVEMERRPFSRDLDNKRPHESDLCEGCKHGHCIVMSV